MTPLVSFPDALPTTLLGAAIALVALGTPTFLLHLMQRPRRHRRAGARGRP